MALKFDQVVCRKVKDYEVYNKPHLYIVYFNDYINRSFTNKEKAQRWIADQRNKLSCADIVPTIEIYDYFSTNICNNDPECLYDFYRKVNELESCTL